MPTHKHDPELLKRIGGRLQALRQARGLTQAKLAALIGIETVTLSRYETGAKGASVTTLSRAAKALGVELRDLFEEAEPREVGSSERAAGLVRQLDPHHQGIAIALLEALVVNQSDLR